MSNLNFIVCRSHLHIPVRPCSCIQTWGSRGFAVMTGYVFSLQGMANGEIFPNCLVVTAARYCFYSGRCLWWRKMELTSGMPWTAILFQKMRIAWRKWKAEGSTLGMQGFVSSYCSCPTDRVSSVLDTSWDVVILLQFWWYLDTFPFIQNLEHVSISPSVCFCAIRYLSMLWNSINFFIFCFHAGMERWCQEISENV